MTAVYHVIGLMSGTSLDGLDIAYCRFWQEQTQWHYTILAAETAPYPTDIRQALGAALDWSAWEYVQWHQSLAVWFGQACQRFIQQHQLTTIDFVASHGHTIFHQPHNGITAQIGNGATIAAHLQLPVVCDFRTTDVALGGQGAPLVPIGDALLFHAYESCLNIGGIANCSFQKDGVRIAGDICPTNIVLNELANRLGKEYDEGGAEAAQGELLWGKQQLQEALMGLASLDFYRQPFPKSLGKEWIWKSFVPALLLHVEQATTLDTLSPTQAQQLLCLATQHAAQQIAITLQNTLQPSAKVLVTGGGAWNNYLIDHLQALLPTQHVVVPIPTIVAFKEALIFAFLGVLRWRNEVNCLQSVTGALCDNVGGVVYWGKNHNNQ